MEDHLGDMDFKLQELMKVFALYKWILKLMVLLKKILQEALAQPKWQRKEIMANMMAVISEPRKELSPYAPKVQMIKIETDQIKSVIGQGGKTINEIIEQSDGVKIDIEQDGTVIVYHHDQEAINKAIALIERLLKKPSW